MRGRNTHLTLIIKLQKATDIQNKENNGKRVDCSLRESVNPDSKAFIFWMDLYFNPHPPLQGGWAQDASQTSPRGDHGWPGNALGITWEELVEGTGKGHPGLPCCGCCHRNPDLENLKVMVDNTAHRLNEFWTEGRGLGWPTLQVGYHGLGGRSICLLPVRWSKTAWQPVKHTRDSRLELVPEFSVQPVDHKSKVSYQWILCLSSLPSPH